APSAATTSSPAALAGGCLAFGAGARFWWRYRGWRRRTLEDAPMWRRGFSLSRATVRPRASRLRLSRGACALGGLLLRRLRVRPATRLLARPTARQPPAAAPRLDHSFARPWVFLAEEGGGAVFLGLLDEPLRDGVGTADAGRRFTALAARIPAHHQPEIAVRHVDAL